MDREGHTIRYTTYEAFNSILPQFVRFDSTSLTYIISPTFFDAARSYTIRIDLSDTFDAVSTYSFRIAVIDSMFPNGSNSNTSYERNNTSFKPQEKRTDPSSNISFVKIALTQITRDQLAVLKFYDSPKSGLGTQQLVKQISNDSFQAILNQNNVSSIIPCEIVSKDTVKSLIQIKLNYPDNSNISVSSTPDSLKILNLNRFTFKIQ